MKRRQSMMGTLLTAFNNAKTEALFKGKRDLEARNKPKNKKEKANRKIEETIVSNGAHTDIVLELWEKIDSEHIRITAEMKTSNVEVETGVEDILK